MLLRPRPPALASACLALGLALVARGAAAQPAQRPGQPLPWAAGPYPSAAPPPAVVPPPPPVVSPRPLTPLHADYPEGAHGDAEVILAIVVNADGTVRSARPLSGAEPFAAAAVAASSGWRFDPATRGGNPISATIKALITFTAPLPPEPVPEVAPPIAAVGGPPPKPAPPKALEVTVRGEQAAPGVQSFTRAEVRLLPGAFGDPFRAIDALPGVTPLVSGLPFFYVRGAPPGDVGYYLDGIRVPLLYHIGLGPSVIHPAMVDHVDLYSGGYPASFGRYAGGIVSGETREADPAWHAEANIRIVDAGAMAQGPLPGDMGSFIVAGRYSYTAALLSVISSNISLAYWDYQARANIKVTSRDTLTIFAFGAHDFLGTRQRVDCPRDPVSDLPTEQRSGKPCMGIQTLFDTTFHRLDLRYDHRFGGPEDHVREAITFGYDNTAFSPITFVDDYLIAARSEITKRVSDSLLVRAGLDAQVDAFKSTLDLGTAFSGDNAFTRLFPDHTETTVGLRADAVITITPRVEVTPGVRLDFFGSHRWNEGPASYTAVAVDPRLAVRFVAAKDLRVIVASGIASQAPSFILPGPGFARDLEGGLQRSFQSSLGIEADLPLDVSATVTVFRDAFFNLTDALGSSTLDPNNIGGDLNSRVDGSSIGLEVMLRRRLTRRLGGLISYTLSRSERIVPTGAVPSAFDRTHVLNVAGSYDLGHGIKIGTRMVLYTGFPINNLKPSEGRVPTFFRFDARAEKRWSIVHGRGWVSLVLEGENIFGAKETIQETPVTGGYSATQIGPVSIPSIGLEGGF